MTDAFRHFHWSTFPIYLLVSLIFFAIGLYIGWLLWRHSREESEAVRETNAGLRRTYEDLKQAFRS